MRWRHAIQHRRVTIKWVSGADDGLADFLSRFLRVDATARLFSATDLPTGPPPFPSPPHAVAHHVLVLTRANRAQSAAEPPPW